MEVAPSSEIRDLMMGTRFYSPRRYGVGAGLGNLGNSCFLNAVLQCLIHTVPFVEIVLSNDHCIEDNGYCSFCAIILITRLSLFSQQTTIMPVVLHRNLSKISSSFQAWQQEDAHEFLRCLLDSLDESYRNHATSEKQHRLFINGIFGGSLLSQVQCCVCGHISNTSEALLDLSLEIENVDDLHDALVSFTKVEKIDDPDMMFSCEGCKGQVSVQKQLRLEKLPTVAVLHLKRFTIEDNAYVKSDKHVDYPMELNLQPFSNTTLEGVESKYDLCSVVVHSGTDMQFGHYYSFVRTSPDMWYEMNDEEIRIVSEEFVKKQQAYILLYIKRGSSPWFSNFMEGPLSPVTVSNKQICFESSPENENHSDEALEIEYGGMPEREEDTDIGLNDVLQAHSLDEEDACCPSLIGEGDDDCNPEKAAETTCEPPPMAPSSCSSPKAQRIVELFCDEPLEEEKVDYHVLPRLKKVVKPTVKVEEQKGLQVAINRQMRNMPCSRRQALMAHMPPSYSSYSPEHRRKRRLGM